MKNLRTIFFDFDGVLCHDRFYGEEFTRELPNVYEWIQANIFGNKELVHGWMRGRLTSGEINTMIARGTGADPDMLSVKFTQSIRAMRLDPQVMEMAGQLKRSGYCIGLVTDNMDVFTQITVKNHGLDTLFDGIVNSADYGYLKRDANGKLFDIALEKIGGDSIGKSLLIDDSAGNCDVFRLKGGRAHRYASFSHFSKFIQETMILNS